MPPPQRIRRLHVHQHAEFPLLADLPDVAEGADDAGVAVQALGETVRLPLKARLGAVAHDDHVAAGLLLERLEIPGSLGRGIGMALTALGVVVGAQAVDDEVGGEKGLDIEGAGRQGGQGQTEGEAERFHGRSLRPISERPAWVPGRSRWCHRAPCCDTSDAVSRCRDRG